MEPDYRSLSQDQLISRLQIAMSENKHLTDANKSLHRMIEVLREQGWATPRPVGPMINIRDYPMGGDQGGPVDRTDLARRLAEANERADYWRKKYSDLLDQTGRGR